MVGVLNPIPTMKSATKSVRFTPRQKALLALIATAPAVIKTQAIHAHLFSCRTLWAKARAVGVPFSYCGSGSRVVLWNPARDTTLNTRHIGAYDALTISGLTHAVVDDNFAVIS